ncbi:MAG TPA: DNA mismatch repair protein MutS [Desulfomicrobiaceae bacterium]|nr:DNA mismatch repair protein MutS [Desulfomicrobiaceae bacterium]
MTSPKLTPMMEQYLRIKEEHPDALLFYRMGDFYELFFDDAEIAARELQIALTSRNPNSEHRVPMCGMPHHSTEEYLRQLLEKGYKVAICDQVEDPKQAKGLVRREVTRILTPGTVLEDCNLEAKGHNYLAAAWFESGPGGGLAWVDFSTGEWTGVTVRRTEELWQWVRKMNPRELLLPQPLPLPAGMDEQSIAVTRVPASAYFSLKGAADKICSVQQTASLEPLDLHDKPSLTRACGALLTYLSLTQKQDLGHLAPFSPLHPGKGLLLDEVTERNLELFRRMDGKQGPGTLWHALDQTMTPMGGRLLASRLRSPWKDSGPIEDTLAAVDLLIRDDGLREKLRALLDSVHDVERLITRIFLNRCTPKDFVALRQSLQILPDIPLLFASLNHLPGVLEKTLESWDPLVDLRNLLDSSLKDNPGHLITEGGLFKTGYDQDLDELIELTEHGESTLKSLVTREQQEFELPRLKLGFNKVFGYYLELSNAHKGGIPDHFIRRQTLVNSERYITEELKSLEERLFSASDKRKTREYALFIELREQVAEARDRLMRTATRLAHLDYWQGLAYAARKWEWSRPELHNGLEISVKSARHPAVEAVQGRANYIPNDLNIDEEGRVLLITGPNMAGKSTVLRQAAIICILAQIGSFVPARQARIGLCDRIFSRVGASDNLAMGQSTFMVEMSETARILRQAGKRSLIILDEIGRGTSTFDGLSLAWAVMEELARRQGGIRTLFATHYHELTALAGDLPCVRNFNIAVKEWKGDIVFLRRLVPGPADRSYGIEVAKLAGVPSGVVQRAKEILADLERRSQRSLQDQGTAVRARQSVLPGMFSEHSVPAAPEPDPVRDALAELDLNGMTPLDALNTLHDWKQKWGTCNVSSC